MNLHEWQVRETEAAIKEADAQDFAPCQEISDLAMKWKISPDDYTQSGERRTQVGKKSPRAKPD